MLTKERGESQCKKGDCAKGSLSTIMGRLKNSAGAPLTLHPEKNSWKEPAAMSCWADCSKTKRHHLFNFLLPIHLLSLFFATLFPLLFFQSFTPLLSLPPPWILCFFSMSPHWNKRNQDLTNSCERKWLKKKKDCLFLGETGIHFLGRIEKKKKKLTPTSLQDCRSRLCYCLQIDTVEATRGLEKWTLPSWVKLSLSPSIIIMDRFRLKWLWNALSLKIFRDVTTSNSDGKDWKQCSSSQPLKWLRYAKVLVWSKRYK